MAPMPGMIDAMYSSMIILVLPCFFVCTMIAVMAYRRRNATDER